LLPSYFSDFGKIIKDNINTICVGDYKVGDVDLNTLCNLALLRLDHVSITPSAKHEKKLTKKQLKQMRAFYSPYVRFMTDRYHRLYTAKTGKFYPQYIPEEMFFMWIDRYFCHRQEARYLDNKCYYYKLFSHIKLPEAVALKIGNTWLDSDFKVVSTKTIREKLRNEKEVVVKQATNSEGGYGVKFVNGAKLADVLFGKIARAKEDFVIQRPVRQHKDMVAFHPESVNTMRIVSLLTGDKVKVYAVSLKVGVGKERIDNGCHGGIYCGVKPDGSLMDYGISDKGEVIYKHPTLGYSFSGKKIPHLNKAIKLVKEAHSFMGHFRLVSWDVAIDDDDEAVLIEANLTLGGINDVQMSNGRPLFGKDTKKILDEVFGGRRKVTTLL
jgi:hypothetical protein